ADFLKDEQPRTLRAFLWTDVRVPVLRVSTGGNGFVPVVTVNVRAVRVFTHASSFGCPDLRLRAGRLVQTGVRASWISPSGCSRTSVPSWLRSRMRPPSGRLSIVLSSSAHVKAVGTPHTCVRLCRTAIVS